MFRQAARSLENATLHSKRNHRCSGALVAKVTAPVEEVLAVDFLAQEVRFSGQQSFGYLKFVHI